MSHRFFIHFPLGWILGSLNFHSFKWNILLKKNFKWCCTENSFFSTSSTKSSTCFSQYLNKCSSEIYWEVESWLKSIYIFNILLDTAKIKVVWRAVLICTWTEFPFEIVLYLLAVVLKSPHGMSVDIYDPWTSIQWDEPSSISLDAQWGLSIPYKFCFL